MTIAGFITSKISLSILLIAAVIASGHDQNARCRAEHKQDAPKYRIGRMRRGVLDNEQILLLQISIKREYFNRKDMTALARRLNEEYCNERRLNVAISDDYRVAKDTYLIHDLLTHETNPGLRGFYDLNRTTSKEGISFSTQRGKPLNEIEINLSTK